MQAALHGAATSVLPFVDYRLAGRRLRADFADGGHRRPVVPRVRNDLAVAIMISLVISLTMTPMMCAYLFDRREAGHDRLYRAGERVFRAVLACTTADFNALQWPALVMLSLLATLGFATYYSSLFPRGLFRSRTTG